MPMAAAAHAGDDGVRQAVLGVQDLLARFDADTAMKIANHHGIRMRAKRGTQQVMGGRNVGHPIPHGFADGVFQGAAADGNPHHLCAQEPHAKDVEALPSHVFFAHVDGAIESEQRADRGGGDAVLASSGLGDDAVLVHAAREQRLAQAVVDLMRAGVQQIFALEVNTRTVELFRKPPSVVEGCGAAGIGVQQMVQFLLKSWVFAGGEIRVLEFFERAHQHFGDVAAAVRTEVAGAIGLRGYLWLKAASWHACKNRAIRAISFLPGLDSSEEQASMPHG